MSGVLNGNTNSIVKWAVGVLLSAILATAAFAVTGVVNDVRVLKEHDVSRAVADAAKDARQEAQYTEIMRRFDDLNDRLDEGRYPPARRSAVKHGGSSTAVAKSREDSLNGL